MTILSEFVEQRLAGLDWQQKQLAHEWQKQVGEGSVATYVTRLSKLLNDDQEGYEFVLAEGNTRLAGLAAALGCDAEELRRMCEVSHARRTLVLDPRLPEEQRAFFRARVGETFTVVEPEAADASRPREALRDLAKKSRNVIVVLPDDRDRDFFEGAGLHTSRVEGIAPRFRLIAVPDLIPPKLPRLHDTDGMPMVPATPEEEEKYRDLIARLAAANREGRSQNQSHGDWRLQQEGSAASAFLKQIHEADAQDAPVTFRLDSLEEAPTADEVARKLCRDVSRRLPRRFQSSYWDKRDKQQPAHIWFHGGKILALCPPEDPRRNRVAAHHDVRDVSTLPPLVEAIRRLYKGLNPWRPEGQVTLPDEVRAFEEETGIGLDMMSDVLREMRSEGANPDPAATQDTMYMRRLPPEDGRFQSTLDDLLARRFELGKACEGVVFVLAAARDAPLIHAENTSPGHVTIANMGAGRLLQFDITRYDREQPTTVRCWRSASWHFVCDGGDVRVEATGLFNENLEGDVFQSVRRRREEEARRTSDD